MSTWFATARNHFARLGQNFATQTTRTDRAVILLAAIATWHLTRCAVATVGQDLNGDSVYFLAMFRDIFVDHVSIRGWDIQPAPDWFPDAIWMWSLRAVLSPRNAFSGYIGLWLFVWGLGIYALSGEVTTSVRNRFLSGCLAVGFLDWSLVRGRMFSNIVLPNHHGASLLVGLWLLVLISCRPTARKAGWVGLITFLVALSDPIALAWYGAPIFGALIVTSIRFRSWLMLRYAALLGGGLTGALFTHRLHAFFGLTVAESPPLEVDWYALDRVFSFLPGPYPDALLMWVSYLLYGVTLCVAIATAGRLIWTGARRVPWSSQVLLVLVTSATLSLTLGFWVSSWAVVDVYRLRYLQHLIVVPAGAMAVFIAACLSRWRRTTCVLALGILAYLAVDVDGRQRIGPASRILPESECLVNEARARSVELVKAPYFFASVITEVSDGSVRGYPVLSDLSFFRYRGNSFWRNRYDGPDYLVAVEAWQPEVEGQCGELYFYTVHESQSESER